MQLLRHLFWSRSHDDAPAEPVDGIFWARSSGETFSRLVAMGVRRDFETTLPLPSLLQFRRPRLAGQGA